MEEKTKQTAKDKQSLYKNKSFSKELSKQNYNQITQLNKKWTDDLFPPNEESLYSGKTDFSKNQYPEMPKFLKVRKDNFYIY